MYSMIEDIYSPFKDSDHRIIFFSVFLQKLPIKQYCLKRQCREIFYHFLLKRLSWPHMNGQKNFRELFRFRKNIRSQNSKIACPSRYGHLFLIFNYCCWVCLLTLKYIFPLDCSYKICVKPSEFSKSFRVVNNYADT